MKNEGPTTNKSWYLRKGVIVAKENVFFLTMMGQVLTYYSIVSLLILYAQSSK
jgi:hypothetical protein